MAELLDHSDFHPGDALKGGRKITPSLILRGYHNFSLSPKGLIFPQVGDFGIFYLVILQGINSVPIGL